MLRDHSYLTWPRVGPRPLHHPLPPPRSPPLALFIDSPHVGDDDYKFPLAPLATFIIPLLLCSAQGKGCWVVVLLVVEEETELVHDEYSSKVGSVGETAKIYYSKVGTWKGEVSYLVVEEESAFMISSVAFAGNSMAKGMDYRASD